MLFIAERNACNVCQALLGRWTIEFNCSQCSSKIDSVTQPAQIIQIRKYLSSAASNELMKYSYSFFASIFMRSCGSQCDPTNKGERSEAYQLSTTFSLILASCDLTPALAGYKLTGQNLAKVCTWQGETRYYWGPTGSRRYQPISTPPCPEDGQNRDGREESRG